MCLCCSDGTVDVVFDDGDKESKVDEGRVRPVEDGSPAPMLQRPNAGSQKKKPAVSALEGKEAKDAKESKDAAVKKGSVSGVQESREADSRQKDPTKPLDPVATLASLLDCRNRCKCHSATLPQPLKGYCVLITGLKPKSSGQSLSIRSRLSQHNERG